MARQGFFLPPYAAVPGFEPTSVELHLGLGPLKDPLPTELQLRCQYSLKLHDFQFFIVLKTFSFTVSGPN